LNKKELSFQLLNKSKQKEAKEKEKNKFLIVCSQKASPLITREEEKNLVKFQP